MLRGLFNKPTKEWLEGDCNKNSVYVDESLGASCFQWEFGTCGCSVTLVFRTGIADSKTVEKCRLTAAEFFAVRMKTKPDILKTLMLVAWKKSTMGWTNFNTDGSALGCLGKDGGGRLIRDHKGGIRVPQKSGLIRDHNRD